MSTRTLTAEMKRDIVRRLFAGITVRVGWVRFELDRQVLFVWLMDRPPESQPDERPAPFLLEQPMSVRRREVENRMVIANGASMPRPDAGLIDFIVRANSYLAALTDGSARTLGGEQKVTVQRVHVNDGGQAVVGNVTHKGGGSRKAKDQPHAVGHAESTAMPGHIEAQRQKVPVTRSQR